MIDPSTTLSFSISSAKGTYALLLGSGLSSAAGIPTGWEVTLDLIRKLAAIASEDCQSDPEAWYKAKYGTDANYSDLLDSLAKTSADRTNLLSSYFEPSSEDIGKGLKTPTAAHKSIARLVRKGYIRVIMTTNFDRLLEVAIESEGVSPAVIATADAAKGALPLAHSGCTVIKLHGDYRDTRIKNTVSELDSYEPEMDRLLDRVLDEYGLIVCGWSAVWDKALYRAILRCPNRRFATFWTRRSHLADEATSLIKHRLATELEVKSADAFFSEVEQKVDAIERYSQPHPSSAKLAVASLKKFIAEDRYRIELRDLVASEAERTFSTLSPLPVLAPGLKFEDLFERMKLYEGASQVLIHLLAHGAYWGGPTELKLWRDTIVRIEGLNKVEGGTTALLALRNYPACLLFYAVGLGSTTADNGDTLKALYRDISIVVNGDREPLILNVLPWNVMKAEHARQIPGYGHHLVSMNDRIYDALREPMREYLADDSDYADTFDLFEYLTALVHLDRRLQRGQPIAPVGRFYIGRSSAGVPTKRFLERLPKEGQAGEDWLRGIVSHVFPSLSRYAEVVKVYEEQILPRVPYFG